MIKSLCGCLGLAGIAVWGVDSYVAGSLNNTFAVPLNLTSPFTLGTQLSSGNGSNSETNINLAIGGEPTPATPTATTPSLTQTLSQTLLITKAPQDFESCYKESWQFDDPLTQDFGAFTRTLPPPDYGTHVSCINPSMSTYVEDPETALCCDMMHSIYEASKAAWKTSQSDCLTKTVLDVWVPLATPTPLISLRTTYNNEDYHGGFTTLCDGVPRATSSVEPTVLTVTADIIASTGFPQTVITTYLGRDVKPSPYPYEPPKCTVAPKACLKLWQNALGFDKVLELMDETAAGGQNSVTPANILESSVETNWTRLYRPVPICWDMGLSCPLDRYYGSARCPSMTEVKGYDSPHVDVLVWPPDLPFHCDKNNGSAPPTSTKPITAIIGTQTLTYPTLYAFFEVLSEKPFNQLYNSWFPEGFPSTAIPPASTHRSVILPIKNVGVQGANTWWPYKENTFGTSINRARPTESVPLAPWSIYSSYHYLWTSMSHTGLDQLVVNVPKTIYHDMDRWILRYRVDNEDLSSINPCWAVCGGQMLASDPPIVLTVVDPTAEASLTLPNLPVPPASSVTAIAQETPAGDGGKGGGTGNDGGLGPGVTVNNPPPAAATGAVAGNVLPASTATLQATRPAAPGLATQTGAGSPPNKPGVSQAPPLQVAITPGHGKPPFTATAIDASGSTFVANGRTFSAGGSSIIVGGATLSAAGNGNVVVGGSSPGNDTDDGQPGTAGDTPKKSASISMIPVVGTSLIVFLIAVLVL